MVSGGVLSATRATHGDSLPSTVASRKPSIAAMRQTKGHSDIDTTLALGRSQALRRQQAFIGKREKLAAAIGRDNEMIQDTEA